MGKITKIVSSIIVMIATTFFYLMAQIKESPVPTGVSIIYGTSMALQIIASIKNAIQLDIQLWRNKRREVK